MPEAKKPEEDKKREAGEITRRQFLAGAGLVVGGAAVGVGGAAYAWLPKKEVKVPVEVEVPRYICPYCGSDFDTFDKLSNHISDEHPDEEIITQFACPYCNEKFPSIDMLRTHLGTEGLIKLNVNECTYELKVKSNWTLAFILREKLGLTGTKIGCDRGSCGTCTVIVDGKSIYSCMMLAVDADGRNIVTIEGLSDGIMLHPVQQAFVDNDASQCGYCTPGFIMSAKALLDRNPNPTRDEVREALSGHICICGHTKKIVDAVLSCAEKG